MHSLSKFLCALGEDPTLRAEFENNPGNAARQAGLDENTAQALARGDRTAIYAAAGAGGAPPPKIISLPRSLA